MLATDRLHEIQGNILKGFGRNHGVFLVLKFRDQPASAPAIAKIILKYITSAQQQNDMTLRWKAGKPSGVAGMFGISHSGSVRLNIHPGLPTMTSPEREVFRHGVAEAVYSSQTDPKGEWDDWYKKNDIDAFLFLGDDDPALVRKTAKAALADLQPYLTSYVMESVHRRVDANEDDTEHFGFRDAISRAPNPQQVFSRENIYSMGFGCFAALLKIEQHVEKFREAAAELSRQANDLDVPLTPQQAEQLAIGRKHSGEPLVSHNSDLNDFNFWGASPEQCPHQAHVRIMNPRDGQSRGPIIRRGMSYDNGLMFLSFQRSLKDDFQPLMVDAARKRDPILSRSKEWVAGLALPTYHCIFDKGGKKTPGQPWHVGGKTVCFPFADVTTVRGGNYFYIPSISFLTAVTQQEPVRSA